MKTKIKAKHQREVRVGLVLYGGVSLAVYENGVAQELYRAVCGEGVYGLLADLIDSDIVIDIVSGTSAGGVNGVMLTYALAQKKQFAPSADLWRNEGDIMLLMKKPSDSNDSSVLSSEYYQKHLAECFSKGLEAANGAAPEVAELDLFVTSTDANGDVYTVFDDLGHPIDIKNHRALFKLAYRAPRKNNFDTPAQVLAKLCRMTSCFPVAFEPVLVDASNSDDKPIFDWGKLHKSGVYLDGGILNNKPFTSTIEAIASRTATREVERILIYVEPNPERFGKPPDSPSSPSMAQAGFASLVSIPGYQSIAGDLHDIELHNERAESLAEILSALPAAPKTTPACVATAGIVEPEKTDPDPYYAARLIQLRDAAVEAIINDQKKGRQYFPTKEIDDGSNRNHNSDSAADQNPPWKYLRRSGRILVESFNAWPGDGHESLRNYDIFFRMRRTKHLMDALMHLEKQGNRVPQEVWDAVNHSFKLYEIVQAAIIGWLTQFEFGWKNLSSEYPDLDMQPQGERDKVLTGIANAIWGQVKITLDIFLHAVIAVPELRLPVAREEFHQALMKKLDEKPTVLSEEPNLLDRLDDLLKQTIAGLASSSNSVEQELGSMLRDEFCRFIDVDRKLLLLQVGAQFESTDIIRVVRFSPLDAQRYLSEGEVQNKVRGSVLSSFGGFFKKSWRANDIMMGRLDATCLLVESLLTKQRLATIAARQGKDHSPMTASKIEDYFPNLGPKAATLADAINNYMAQAANATDDMWNGMVDQIVCASQDQIQAEEWPTVIHCAIEQEYDWGQYRKNAKAPFTPYDPGNLFWNRAKARPDEVIVQVAAEAFASHKIPPFAPGKQKPGSFIEEIPESVLQELAAQAAIRLGKGLIASIPDMDSRSKWAGSPFYSIPFNWLAPCLYNWNRMRRMQPGTVIITNTVVPTFLLTVLALAIALPSLGVPIEHWHRLIGAGSATALLVIWARYLRR